MKSIRCIFSLVVALMGTSVFGADGDLIVNGKVGIGTATPARALEVYGGSTPLRLRHIGTAAGKNWRAGPDSWNAFCVYNQNDTGVYLPDGYTSWYGLSDQRLKTNIQPLAGSSSLAAIDALNPVSFNWIAAGATKSSQFGFIAQQVQAIFPELVSDGPDATIIIADGSTSMVSNPLGLNYTGFIPPLVKAVQALNHRSGALLSSTAMPSIFVDQNGNVGIGANDPAGYMLHVNGAAYLSSYAGSDLRLKKDIQPLDNALPLIQVLEAIRYSWKSEEFPDRNLDRGPQIGLIAQDVEKVLPELVKTDLQGYKAISYEKLSAVLVQAIKEQQKRIEKLEGEIDALKVRQ